MKQFKRKWRAFITVLLAVLVLLPACGGPADAGSARTQQAQETIVSGAAGETAAADSTAGRLTDEETEPSGEAGRADGTESPDEAELSDQTGQAKEPEAPDKSEPSDEAGRTKETESSGNAGQTDQTDQAKDTESSDKAGQADQTGQAKDAESSGKPTQAGEAESSDKSAPSAEDLPDPDGEYSTKDEVALYLHLYGRLPSNYITKQEARDLGWDSGEGNLWTVAPGKSIGGDYFGNREELLAKKKGRSYYECDINYAGGYRGGERIVFSDDGLIYYSADHYENFELLYDAEGKAE